MEPIQQRIEFSPSVLSAAVVLGVFALTTLSLVLFSAALTPSHYKTLHFALTYETEFLKRGLIGEIFRIFSVSPWGEAPGRFTLIVFWMLTALYALASHALLRRSPEPVLAVILLALWAAPTAVPHLAFDYGRADIVLILILCLWGFASFVLSATASITALAIVSVAGLLIHEIALFVTAPLGLGLWLTRYDKRLISLHTLAFGAVVSVAFVLVWTFGKADVSTLGDIREMIAAQYGAGDYSVELMQLLLFGGVVDNAAYSAEQGARYEQSSEHAKFFIFMSGHLLLLAVMLWTCVRRGRIDWPVIFTCLLPLAVYPLGFDYFRWLSLAVTNLTILLIWAMLHSQVALNAIVVRTRPWRFVILSLVFAFLVVGPVEIYTSMDIRASPAANLVR